MIISQIIFGLLAIIVGVVTLKYNYQLVGFTGNVDWFERFLGPAGTYLGFKILSLFIIACGILYMTGLYSPILDLLVKPLSIFFPSASK